MAGLTGSPMGGTTSLPQYLQKRQPMQRTDEGNSRPNVAPIGQPTTMLANGGLTGANGAALQKPATQPTVTPPKTQTTSAAPAGGAPNVTPVNPNGANVQIPPAPPPPAPAPAPAAPAQPAPLSGLQQSIADWIKNPGQYGSAEIQAMRESGMNNLEDLRRSEQDRLTSEFAGRGMLRSTGLNTSLGDLSERYIRGAQDLEADLLDKAAQSRGQGLPQAIQAALGFGQGELANNQFLANLALALQQLGMQGGPTIPGAVGDYGNMPLPTPGDNSWIYQLLGGLYPQQKAA